MRKNHRLSKTLVLYGAIGAALFSIALAMVGELETLIASWSALILLLPTLLLTLKMRYVALRVISLLAFLTQVITLPFFYLNRQNFVFRHVKPYQFTGLEALLILLKVSFFLILLNFIFTNLYKVSFFGGASRNITNGSNNLNLLFAVDSNSPFKSSSRVVGGIYTLILSFCVAALIPLNLWMFSQGISVVGIEPPALPYRLSGILHYFTKYIAVSILVYIYCRTSRSWLPMSLMLGYAWILGFSSLSRSSLMFVALPVLFIAWVERRKLMVLVAFYLGLLGFISVTSARNYVYFVSDGKTGGNFDLGLLQVFLSVIYDQEFALFDLKTPLYAMEVILNRLEGFENLVMSQFYDPYQVEGPLAIIMSMIWEGFNTIDCDAHHIQWQGSTLPKGFVNGGGLLSNVVILGNAGWWWIVLLSLIAAATLVILEKSARSLDCKYGARNLLSTPVVIFLSILYFTGNSGTHVFVLLLVFLLFMSFLPPFLSPFLRVKNKLQKKGTYATCSSKLCQTRLSGSFSQTGASDS